MRNKNVRLITQAAIIAALYVVLTLIANALGLAKFAIQIRFSESLCIMPFFTFAAVPGLYVGCLIANIITDFGVKNSVAARQWGGEFILFLYGYDSKRTCIKSFRGT